jgi:hypothetical protein
MAKWLITFFLSLTLLACGSGGKDSETSSFEPKPKPELKESENIFFNQSELIVKLNKEFTVNIEIGSVKNIFGVTFDLEYEPTKIEFRGLVEGDLLNQDNNPTFFAKSASTEDGIMNFGFSRLNRRRGTVNGPGQLGDLIFKAIKEGEVSLNFTKNQVCIIEGESRYHYYKNIPTRGITIKIVK